MREQTLNNKQYLKNVVKPKLGFFFDIHSHFWYVMTLIGCGLLFFGFALVTQKFTTPFSGDYSQQGIPFAYNFYDCWWTFFKTGKFPMYDSNVMLGADNITANTFYGLFSPFVFPLLFFPRSWIPQMTALMEIARLVVGGLLFRKYLKYLGVSENTARIFSIAYAFTGWTTYVLWFNSFYEVATFFPMVLWGIEKCIKERKIGILASGLFLLGISNYFFFITSGVFGVIYAIFRFFQTVKTRTAKESFAVIGLGVLGFAVGFGMTAIVCLPAILSSFGMSRAQSSTYFTDLRIALSNHDWKEFRKLFFHTWNNPGVDTTERVWAQFYPLASFFFPNISCCFVNIFRTNFDNFQSSIFLYTPMMILFFASLYRSFVNKKISHFIALAMVVACLFIPFFYQLCGAFSIGYGRWEIVVPLVALAYLAINFDHRDEMPRGSIIASGVICLLEMVALILVAERMCKRYSNNLTDIGGVYALVIYEMVMCVVCTGLLVGFWKKKNLGLVIKILLAIEITGMGTVVANVHSLLDYDTQVCGGFDNVPYETEIISKINENDNSYFRLQNTRAYEGNDNLSMVEGYNGVSTFHSFYNTEINDFCVMSQVLKSNDTWVGSDFLKRANLEEFLGVKYYVSKESETTYTNSSGEPVVFNQNIPLQYERIDEDDDGYRVYKNKYQIDFATSYDTIYLKNECSTSHYNNFYGGYTTDVIRNEEAYFKGAILNNDDAYEVASNPAFNLKTIAPDREARRISTTLSMYLPDVYFDPFNPYRDLVSSNRISIGDIVPEDQVNKLQLVIDCSSTSGFPQSSDGIYYMIDYPVRSYWYNNNATVFAVCKDADDNPYVATFDSYRYNSRDGGSAIRGLSVKDKVDKIIICPNGTSYRNYVNVYYEDYTDLFARYQTAQNNGVSNVKCGVNKYEFDTNYSTNRFVITQIAYTKGWSVKAIHEDGREEQLKAYNAQGAFVGFVAPEGNVHYVMSYCTPHLKTGALISIASLTLCVGTSVGVYFIQRKKKHLKEE